jgi:hypothetical protein
MTADTLLARLDGVKRTGVDRWLARCPAHDDKRPSLSVREIDGERTLVHCWAGCAVGDVLAAVGLTLEALYPERPSQYGKPERRPFPAADVLRAVEWETLIAAVAASYLGNGGHLTDCDRKRLFLAASRLTAAVRESGHA